MESFILHIANLPFLFQIFIFGLSILGIWYGAEKIIWAARNIARYFRVPELLIGLTIAAIGSSLPEIFINVKAGLNGIDDVGVGNIVGSCFVQISLILGICVLFGGPIYGKKKKLKRDVPLVLGSIILLFFWSLDGVISVIESLVSVAIYIGYMVYLFKNSSKKNYRKTPLHPKPILWIFVFLLGLFILWISSEILLSLAIHKGREIGISEGIIGLFSGIGTSIPELSISLMALLRKSNGLSIGNLLGSNITDPLFSLSMGAILAGGYKVDDFFIFTAIPFWFLASSFVMCLLWFQQKITRIPAVLLVVFYFGSFGYFLSVQ